MPIKSKSGDSHDSPRVRYLAKAMMSLQAGTGPSSFISSLDLPPWAKHSNGC